MQRTEMPAIEIHFSPSRKEYEEMLTFFLASLREAFLKKNNQLEASKCSPAKHTKNAKKIKPNSATYQYISLKAQYSAPIA